MTPKARASNQPRPSVLSTHQLTVTGAKLYGQPAPLFLRYSVASGEHHGHRFEIDISGATVIVALKGGDATVRTMAIDLGAIVEPALDIMIDDLAKGD